MILPRWMALTVASTLWVVAIPLVHAVVPWGLSSLGPRRGWAQGQPGIWNMCGLVPVLVGAVCLLWVLVLHLVETPEQVALRWTPRYLLRRGPYAFTRNPMYLAEVVVWLGWTLWFGSVAVLVGVILLWAAIQFGVLPREERALEERLGEVYRQYQDAVPRWLWQGHQPLGPAEREPRAGGPTSPRKTREGS